MRKQGANFLWLLILLALIFVIGALLIGGDILVFLAPRMEPMAWFGWIVLIALCVFQCFHIFRNVRQSKSASFRPGMLLFLIPVILILTVTPNPGTFGSLLNRAVKILVPADASVADARSGMETAESAPAGETGETAASGDESDPADLSPCTVEAETARFSPSDDRFSEYLRNTLEEVNGKTITVYGFVYTDASFPENTALVARTMVSCCAADASIVGFHVRLDPSADLSSGEWVRVTGIIRRFRMDYEGEQYDFPILTDGIILRCDAPDAENAYIYP